MDKSYELLIFDWDGTLIDSEANIVECMKIAIDELDLPKLDDAKIKNIIGLGLSEALNALYPGISDKTSNQLVDRYRYHFLTREPSQPFTGVERTLNWLTEQKFLLAVATGKGRKGLDKALLNTGYNEIFHSTRCADETQSKPHPQMLHEILEDLGVEAHKALMIGDTEYDINMAHNAGVDSIAVSYGVHEQERLLQCNPKACLNNIEQLVTWLQV